LLNKTCFVPFFKIQPKIHELLFSISNDFNLAFGTA